eukprot:728604-Rhodomonas_salina.3
MSGPAMIECVTSCGGGPLGEGISSVVIVLWLCSALLLLQWRRLGHRKSRLKAVSQLPRGFLHPPSSYPVLYAHAGWPHVRECAGAIHHTTEKGGSATFISGRTKHVHRHDHDLSNWIRASAHSTSHRRWAGGGALVWKTFLTCCAIAMCFRLVAAQDVDECALGSHDCGANAACTNTDGAFTCACNAGYFANELSLERIEVRSDGTVIGRLRFKFRDGTRETYGNGGSNLPNYDLAQGEHVVKVETYVSESYELNGIQFTTTAGSVEQYCGADCPGSGFGSTWKTDGSNPIVGLIRDSGNTAPVIGVILMSEALGRDGTGLLCDDALECDPNGANNCAYDNCTDPTPNGCADGTVDHVFATDEVVGCDGVWFTGGASNGAALCSEGWYMCPTVQHLIDAGVSNGDCYCPAALSGKDRFYASLESSDGSGDCTNDEPGNTGLNDLWGCGCGFGNTLTCGPMAIFNYNNFGNWEIDGGGTTTELNNM